MSETKAGTVYVVWNRSACGRREGHKEHMEDGPKTQAWLRAELISKASEEPAVPVKGK